MSEKVIEFQIPLGGIMMWSKDTTGVPDLPSSFVECNGQTLNDPESPYDGSSIPDLNGNNYFLRGNSSSGGTGGTKSHDLTHTHSKNYVSDNIEDYGYDTYASTSIGETSLTYNNEPPYRDFVYIMKIKNGA